MVQKCLQVREKGNCGTLGVEKTAGRGGRGEEEEIINVVVKPAGAVYIRFLRFYGL